jgi:hypothetical protein
MEHCKYCQAKKEPRWSHEPGFHHDIFCKSLEGRTRAVKGNVRPYTQNPS